MSILALVPTLDPLAELPPHSQGAALASPFSRLVTKGAPGLASRKSQVSVVPSVRGLIADTSGPEVRSTRIAPGNWQ